MEFTTLWTLLSHTAQKYSKRTLFIENEKNISYSKFYEDVTSMHNALCKINLAKKHVALIGPNSYNWVVCYFAVSSVGTVMPIANDLDWTDVERFCKQGDCEVIINAGYPGEIPNDNNLTMIDIQKLLEVNDYSIPVQLPEPSDVAVLVSTSGTMGNNRICMLTHDNLCSDARGLSLAVDCSGRSIAALPLHHSYTILCTIITGMINGAEITIVSDIKKLKKAISDTAPTHIFIVPAIVEGLCDDARRAAKKYIRGGMSPDEATERAFKDIGEFLGPQCRCVIVGGAPMSPSVEELFPKSGVPLITGYGLTECSPAAAINPIGKIKNGSVGPALDGVIIKIIDPNDNGEGEIAIAGRPVMKGYYNDPESMAESFSDGFLLTGDIGRIDEDGYIFITGRKKNIIILSNGKNVMPEEIEKYLNDLPTVIESLVYDAGSDLLGATVYTETPDECKKEIEELNSKMPLHKQVAKIKFIDHPFARNALKKIIRNQEV